MARGVAANGLRFGGSPGGRGKGRKKGSMNKIPRLVREAILIAFDQKGGVDGLVKWSNKSEATQTAFYQLWGRLAPMEVTGGNGGPVEIIVRFVHETPYVAQHG